MIICYPYLSHKQKLSIIKLKLVLYNTKILVYINNIKKEAALKKTNNGFTLAEVLITLGIIGVVAAITIPTIISYTQGLQYRSKFKKTLALLSQAGKMSLTQYDFDYSGINEKCGPNAEKENPENTYSICALLNGTLKGAAYFQKASNLKLKNGSSYTITPTYTATWTVASNTDNLRGYILADGVLILLHKNFGIAECTLPTGIVIKEDYSLGSGDNILDACNGYIDVNGINGPNKEVSCTSGENKLSKQTCIVKNNQANLTDIYPIRFHDGIAEPATAAAKYVLNTTK